jgi:hypothetical protein|tara:strand:- start:90 stop:629 length:540 start_codon:yes stop_codon:yes gene_type:complete
MSLWGNSDNVTSRGTVSLDYSTGQVTGNAGGTGTQFGTVGAAKTGDVIRFGLVEGTYFGDAVITGITSERVLTIGSTAGLSGAAIASTDFFVSELPKYTVLDSTYSETSTTADRRVYGISTSMGSGSFTAPGQGWVGVTTYIQNNADGTTTLRVKSEILVAQSGISTGANSILYPTNEG